MYKHPVRKSFGLFVLYSIIIIGIFVLQFRNESVVSKSVGLLSVSFAQSQSEDGTISLKNTIQASFKGISFTADELKPAQIVLNDEAGVPRTEVISLVSYEQKTPLSYTFRFTNGASLTFAVSDTDSDAALSVSAELPENAEGIFLNYKPTSGFSVTEKTRSKLILNSKNLTYAFTASQIDDTRIFLSRQNPMSYYVAYDPSVEFSFVALDSDMIIAQKSTYDMNIKALRENLVASVADSIKTNQNLSEKSVIAYVAELASQGQYAAAVDSVPDSFKKGNKRTYLSAPYFDTLEQMYPSLEMYKENMSAMISNALETSSLSVFMVDSLADYLNILSNDETIRSLLSLPNQYLSDSSQEQIKLPQASGILSTYIRLSALHSIFADILKPAAEKSLEIIEASCALNDSILTLNEKDAPVSNLLALSTGNALIQWGEFNGKAEYVQAGYALINSILSVNSLDIITMSDIYPILVSNPYYPHFKVLSRSALNTVFAWTCSPSVSYSMKNGNSMISFSFPKGETHYSIVSGIAPFTNIEIYGLSFHSDPRFESYNSSGFIYRATSRTLFLKSRHKNETENISLSYR